jgi:hypothetical protein
MSKIDLSKKPGNLTYDLEQRYEELKAIEDIDELKKCLTNMANCRRHHGLSERNYFRFMSGVGECTTIDEGRAFFTYYVVAGAGLKVIKCSFPK